MAYAGLKGAAIGAGGVLLLAGGGFWLMANALTHGPKSAVGYVDQRTAAVAPAVIKPAAPPPQPLVLSPDELFSRRSPAVVRVIARGGNFNVMQGSGFFISSDGLLVTNYHVIKDAEFASVLRDDNTTLFVEGIAAQDKEADLALLKVNTTDVPYLSIGPDTPPKIGTKVYAIGNPDGLTNTLSEGLISGLRNRANHLSAIQTSAPISHGSSGGPLLTADGAVVGVTASSLVDGQSLNFAVPASLVRKLIAQQGDLQKLASAGAAPLDASQTLEFAAVWDALDRKQYSAASRLLATMRVDHSSNAVFWLATGFLHNELNNTTLAIDAYKEALQINPNLETGWYGLGLVYLKTKQHPEAIDAFKSASKVKPKDTRAYEGAGFAYGAMGDFKKALGFFKKANEFSPEDPVPFGGMGMVYASQKKYAEAIESCQKAIAIKPDYGYGYLPLGLAYMQTGRRADAIAAWQNAIRFDPLGPAGHGAVQMLQLYRQ